mmetsp:Transcript_2193/g.3306  ORF Transcript_2193/g.3306 Transcript_2193/m.3306 type:complete len:176 (-) Transcript_2193:340-867(-)
MEDNSRPEEAEASKVLYIGHLPHGFFEKEIKGYFSQFGKISRVRISRNKKTAKAKHYAFIEFQNAEVAKIVADAMDGYFLFTQKLIVKVIPKNKVHPRLFVGANRKFKAIPWTKVERLRHDKERTPEQQKKRVARLIKRDKKRKEKIAKLGIDYEYTSVKDAAPAKAKKTKFEDN